MMRLEVKIILLYFLLVNSYSFSQNFWERIESPTEEFLRTLHFIDSSKGWVAGDSGLIFYTSDGGASWTQQETNVNYKIVKLFFLDENRGWALAWQEIEDGGFYGTYILKTTDAGSNWISEQYREESEFMWAIHFLDTLKGFMGGAPNVFVETTDGGLTWEQANIDSGVFSNFPVLNFQFYNDLYGYATGGRFDIAGVIWKTVNGGDSWAPLDPLYTPADQVWDIHFFDSSHVMGVGGDPDLYGVGIITSTDAGNSWNYFEIGIFGQARTVSFRTENEGWCPVPLSDNLVVTFDYGNTWTNYTAPDSASLYDLVFTDSLTGYAVGEQGVIVKYKYQRPDFVEADLSQNINNFILYQNFPNPFNPSTNISFYLTEAGEVKLEIYDLLGNQIASLVNEFKSSGNHSITWSAKEEPSGVYLVLLKVNGSSASQKIMLLK